MTIHKEPLKKTPSISIVIPCYNEAKGVAHSLDMIIENLKERYNYEIITINDGSTDETLKVLEEYSAEKPFMQVVNNNSNLGYGASLKKGIKETNADIIVITDADCTYPASEIPRLVDALQTTDMAVGARIGKKVHIPLIRRPAKWILLRYARWLANADIKDLNSGLRAFRKQDAYQYFHILPNGFSFTSTITIAMHINNYSIRYLPINYYKRVGNSSIRPIRDTLAFFSLVLRTTMYFNPLKVFGILASFLILLSIIISITCKYFYGTIPDILTITLFMSGLNCIGLGVICDLINRKLDNIKSL